MQVENDRNLKVRSLMPDKPLADANGGPRPTSIGKLLVLSRERHQSEGWARHGLGEVGTTTDVNWAPEFTVTPEKKRGHRDARSHKER